MCFSVQVDKFIFKIFEDRCSRDHSDGGLVVEAFFFFFQVPDIIFCEMLEKVGLRAFPRFEGEEDDGCQNCVILHAYQTAVSSPTV